MAVIIAVIGVLILLSMFSSEKMKHGVYERRAANAKHIKELYQESYDDHMRLWEELRDGEHIEELKKVYAILPPVPRGRKLSPYSGPNIINASILSVLSGKIPYERRLPIWYIRRVDGEDEYDFDKALLDWMVSELGRHGVNIPLYVRSRDIDETRTLDWRGKPHFDTSVRFFLPYELRPSNRYCELVWNFNNDPPIYPKV